MMAARSLTSGRVLCIVALAAAAVPALPLVLRADPAATPVPAQPLTVPRADAPEAGARREANRARILDARLQQLHAGLQLTAAQEPLWPPVADAIRTLHRARGIRFRQQLEATDDSIDGLKMQGEHMAKVGAAMGRLADATKPLVATLSSDQKSRLPTLLERVRPRKVVARAFAVPVDSEGAGQRGQTGLGVGGRSGGSGIVTPRAAGTPGEGAPPAPGTTTAPGKPSGDIGASRKDDADDDDE